MLGVDILAERFKETGPVGAGRAANRAEAHRRAVRYRIKAVDAGAFQRHHMERGLVHRENRPDVIVLQTGGERTFTIDGIKGGTHCDHAEIEIAGLHQRRVLDRSGRYFSATWNAKRVSNHIGPARPIDEIGSALACSAYGKAGRPVTAILRQCSRGEKTRGEYHGQRRRHSF